MSLKLSECIIEPYIQRFTEPRNQPDVAQQRSSGHVVVVVVVVVEVVVAVVAVVGLQLYPLHGRGVVG